MDGKLCTAFIYAKQTILFFNLGTASEIYLKRGWEWRSQFRKWSLFLYNHFLSPVDNIK